MSSLGHRMDSGCGLPDVGYLGRFRPNPLNIFGNQSIIGLKEVEMGDMAERKGKGRRGEGGWLVVIRLTGA